MISSSFTFKVLCATAGLPSELQRAAVRAALCPFAVVGDALFAVAFAFLTLLPMGPAHRQKNYHTFCRRISTLNRVIPIAFALQCIHPDAIPSNTTEHKVERLPILQWQLKHAKAMNASICKLAASSNLLERYVAARVGCLALTIFLVIARAFYLMVGPFALLMALACKADNHRYNTLAVEGFAAPGAAGDLLDCALRCIYPSLTPLLLQGVLIKDI